MITGNIKTRVQKAIGSNVLAQLANALIQIGGIPILIHTWGVEKYGEWLLIFSIPSYLGLGDLGIGTVASTEITKALAINSKSEATKIFHTGMTISAISAIFLLSVASILTIILPIEKLLNTNNISNPDLKMTIFYLTVYVTISIVLSLPLGIYRSIGKYSRGQIISTIFRLIEFCTFIFIAQYSQGFMYSALGYLLIRTIYITWIFFDIRTQANWVDFSFYRTDIKSVKELLPKSISMMFVYLGQTLLNQGLITIIGIKLGAFALATFSTVRTLCNFSKQLIGIINLSVFSEFLICITRHDYVEARKLHTRTSQANIILTLLSITFLYLAGERIISIWTQGKINTIEPFYSLYLLYTLVNSFWIGSWNMLLGCNEHSKILIHYITMNILILLFTFLTLKMVGISYLPILLIIGDLIFGFIVINISLSLLKDNTINFITRLLRIKNVN